MRTVVCIRNNLLRMRTTVRILIHLLHIRMCDICTLTLLAVRARPTLSDQIPQRVKTRGPTRIRT